MVYILEKTNTETNTDGKIHTYQSKAIEITCIEQTFPHIVKIIPK